MDAMESIPRRSPANFSEVCTTLVDGDGRTSYWIEVRMFFFLRLLYSTKFACPGSNIKPIVARRFHPGDPWMVADHATLVQLAYDQSWNHALGWSSCHPNYVVQGPLSNKAYEFKPQSLNNQGNLKTLNPTPTLQL